MDALVLPNSQLPLAPPPTQGSRGAPLWAQAAKHGFAVSEGSFAVTRKQTYHFKKNGTRPVTLLAVTYEGILQVTDPEAFKALLCEGVGRGKAYGLGLMTIIHRGGDHG